MNNQILLIKSINSHDNILKYINSWYNAPQGIYIIIEELCSGGNINSNYKYIQKPKLKLIKKWIKEILKGLDYLHSNKIIHHDIKCQNIYLDRISGHLKIGCIGALEKLQNDSEYFEKYAGTPEFMAPEVNEGKYNFKADIYSLGLTLVELLTVQKPYKECEGALNIYINKKKGILPESLKTINDKGIKDFIEMCLNIESKRPTANDILENNKWLNDKNVSENNSVIEIKGALRQKNFYLNYGYKSGTNISIQRHHLSNKNIVKYSSKMFNNFNLNNKKSLKAKDNSGNTDNKDNSFFSFKNNINNKSITTSRTDNLISNTSYNHFTGEDNHDMNDNNNKIIDINSNNISRKCSFNNITQISNINIYSDNFKNQNTEITKPIIKEKNNSNSEYSLNIFNSGKIFHQKYFSPVQNNMKKIVIPHLNFGSIKNSQNINKDYPKINSFRESNHTSSIKSINIHFDDNDYNNNECYDNDYYINFNIIYT